MPHEKPLPDVLNELPPPSIPQPPTFESDIQEQRDRVLCLKTMLNESPDPATEYAGIVFLPTAESDAALYRLSIRFPSIVEDIRNTIRFCERACDKLRERPNDGAAKDTLLNGMESLLHKMESGIAAMTEAHRAPPPTPADEKTKGFHSAEWLRTELGILPERLSENRERIKTIPAPRGFVDVEGKKPRKLWHVEDAEEHCTPKRRTSKRR